jgi:hypothetical protein
MVNRMFSNGCHFRSLMRGDKLLIRAQDGYLSSGQFDIKDLKDMQRLEGVAKFCIETAPNSLDYSHTIVLTKDKMHFFYNMDELCNIKYKIILIKSLINHLEKLQLTPEVFEIIDFLEKKGGL